MRSPNTAALLALASVLAACGEAAVEPAADPSATVAAAIPENLAPFGDGYPNAGDPCRTLGESDVTSKYLDDSAWLVGCPDETSGNKLGGTVIGSVGGIRLISVPMGDANADRGEEGPSWPIESVDAKVAGTEYNATAEIKCGFKNSAPTLSCPAGVKRKWGEEKMNLVEVTKPDGRNRAIFFKGTMPIGADSAQSDGSSAWDFHYDRNGDTVSIRYGPETYVIVDAFVEGG